MSLKNNIRRFLALVRFIGLDHINSASISDPYVSFTCKFSYPLIHLIETHKFKAEHNKDYLFYRRGPYWIFIFDH